MKILSRLFRTASASPLPPPAEAAPPAEPVASPPAVDPEEQEQLLRTIQSGSMTPAELVRIAVEGPTTRLRQAAAAAIDEPAMWQELLPRLRGRDKAVYRLIKERHDARIAEQRNVEQTAREAEALCASIEKHSARTHDPLYAPTLSVLSARWQALPQILDAGIHQRSQQALDRCGEVVAAHEREIARLAAERDADEARTRTRAAELQAQQQAAAEQAEADAIAHAAAEQAREAEIQTAAESLNEQQAAAALVQTEIVGLIRLSGAALTRGDTRKAARFRQSIDAALPGAPPMPPHLARNLEQLDVRLNELRQWKDYVVAPKRIELIEEMEALIGVDEEPQALAEHIRALRQEWRTINKGIAVEATTESERFEKAFQAAFQPCQTYFAEQASIRRVNLEARGQVLQRVLTFEAGLDAERPDYPLILCVLREAPQEWRGYAPVDRDASRPLDAEFYSALDRLRARVTAWYALNTAEKQALIARAQQLATAADTARAIDEAKRLQTQWNATGPVPHPQSQALWDEFRGLCNAVFERRQQEYAQHSATLDAARAEAVALCDQIEQASQDTPADRPSGEVKLREWRDRFDAIGELPRNDARNLHDRFQRALSHYQALLAGIAQRDADAAEANAVTAARHVRACQRAMICGVVDVERQALRHAAEAFIASVPRWPNKRVLHALRQALARTDSTEPEATDDASREQELRKLCVHAEILSGGSTPPEDTVLRREHQRQLLQQGLGQARLVDARDWEAMRLEWLGLNAAPPEVHDALEQRFMKCLGR